MKAANSPTGGMAGLDPARKVTLDSFTVFKDQNISSFIFNFKCYITLSVPSEQKEGHVDLVVYVFLSLFLTCYNSSIKRCWFVEVARSSITVCCSNPNSVNSVLLNILINLFSSISPPDPEEVQ